MPHTCTFLRCFHRRDIMSHLSGVATMMSPRANSFKSVPVSPVSTTNFLPSSDVRRLQQRQDDKFTLKTSFLLAPVVSHSITQRRYRVYIDYFCARIVGMRSHNSELGANCLARTARRTDKCILIRLVKRTEHLQWYTILNYSNASRARTCVCTGLNTLIPCAAKYSENSRLLSAASGSGCKSSSSVGGGYFSGNICKSA